MRISVMQPYLFPYAGFFRLFTADMFVVYDCVQFNRRGRVHRCELKDNNNRKKWLSLPLAKQPRDTTMIKDLAWGARYQMEWSSRCLRFPMFGEKESLLARWTRNIGATGVLQFITGTMSSVAYKLELDCPMIFSSSLNIDPDIHGQDRMLAICKKLGATEYINSPGGKGLYDKGTFAKEGIKLTFLPEYKGSYDSILERLEKERPENIRKEILDNL